MGWTLEQMSLTSTVDGGKSFTGVMVGKTDDPTVPDFFLPMGISFADATPGWLVGGQKDERDTPQDGRKKF